MDAILQKAVNEERLDSFMSIIKKINTRVNLEETLSMIMAEAKAIINSEASSLMLIDDQTEELYFNVTTGEKGDIVREIRFPIGKGVAGLCAKTSESYIINDAETDPRVYKGVDQKTQMVTKNLVCVPLIAKGKVIGVLEVINRRGGGSYTSEDLELLQAFSDYAAIAINNRELYKGLERKAYEASALYQLSQSVSVCDNFEDLFRENLAVVCEAFDARRVTIIMKEADEFIFKAGVGISDDVIENGKVTVEDNVLSYVLETGAGTFSSDVNDDERFADNKELRYKTRSFVVAPARRGDEIIGFLSVTERLGGIAYKREDLMLLEMLTSQVFENYDHMNLAYESIEKEKIEAELSITARMQQSILPSSFETGGLLDIFAKNLAAREVGGDFYDFFPLGNGKYGIVIADVSGKGMPASLFMAISRSVIRARFKDTISPAKVFAVTNNHIFEDSKTGMFVTAFCCVIDTKTKTITYSNAGHFEQFLLKTRSSSVKALHTKSKPLGVLFNEKFVDKKIKYSKSDFLLLYTDGVSEAVNQRFEQFGEERIKSRLEALDENETSVELINSILDEMDEFVGDTEQFDDITMLGVRF